MATPDVEDITSTALVTSSDPLHVSADIFVPRYDWLTSIQPANLIPELCASFYNLGWVTGTKRLHDSPQLVTDHAFKELEEGYPSEKGASTPFLSRRVLTNLVSPERSYTSHLRASKKNVSSPNTSSYYPIRSPHLQNHVSSSANRRTI